jgi:hypothetical protein
MTQRELYTLILKGEGTNTVTADGKRTSAKIKLYGEDGKFNPAVIDYCEEQIAKLDEKNAGRKDTKSEKEKRAANADLANAILTSFEVGKTYTATQLGIQFGVSAQKITGVIKPLVQSGAIAVTEKYRANKGDNPCKGYHLPTEG